MAKRKSEQYGQDTFYLVREDVLPEVFLKVMDVKRRLDAHRVSSVSEAVRDAGISRSAYYKYRLAIRDVMSYSGKTTYTLLLVLENMERTVQRCLDVFFDSGASVLSFHQGLPINGLIHALVIFQWDAGAEDENVIIRRLTVTRGVVQVIAPGN